MHIRLQHSPVPTWRTAPDLKGGWSWPSRLQAQRCAAHGQRRPGHALWRPPGSAQRLAFKNNPASPSAHACACRPPAAGRARRYDWRTIPLSKAIGVAPESATQRLCRDWTERIAICRRCMCPFIPGPAPRMLLTMRGVCSQDGPGRHKRLLPSRAAALQHSGTLVKRPFDRAGCSPIAPQCSLLSRPQASKLRRQQWRKRERSQAIGSSGICCFVAGNERPGAACMPERAARTISAGTASSWVSVVQQPEATNNCRQCSRREQLLLLLLPGPCLRLPGEPPAAALLLQCSAAGATRAALRAPVSDLLPSSCPQLPLLRAMGHRATGSPQPSPMLLFSHAYGSHNQPSSVQAAQTEPFGSAITHTPAPAVRLHAAQPPATDIPTKRTRSPLPLQGSKARSCLRSLCSRAPAHRPPRASAARTSAIAVSGRRTAAASWQTAAWWRRCRSKCTRGGLSA